MNVWVGFFGVLLTVGGVAAIYWPAGLIIAGLILLKCYTNLEKSESNAGKRQ